MITNNKILIKLIDVLAVKLCIYPTLNVNKTFTAVTSVQDWNRVIIVNWRS